MPQRIKADLEQVLCHRFHVQSGSKVILILSRYFATLSASSHEDRGVSAAKSDDTMSARGGVDDKRAC